MIFNKYLYKYLKHNKDMICPKEELKFLSLKKEKSSLKLQNNNSTHIWLIREELNFMQGTPPLTPWYVICIQIIDEWNKWNKMKEEGIYFILC